MVSYRLLVVDLLEAGPRCFFGQCLGRPKIVCREVDLLVGVVNIGCATVGQEEPIDVVGHHVLLYDEGVSCMHGVIGYSIEDEIVYRDCSKRGTVVVRNGQTSVIHDKEIVLQPDDRLFVGTPLAGTIPGRYGMRLERIEEPPILNCTTIALEDWQDAGT
ncbi:MAG: hypothetical protein ABIG30_02355 [Candidatus Aenigmatarchaeota archaeon]